MSGAASMQTSGNGSASSAELSTPPGSWMPRVGSLSGSVTAWKATCGSARVFQCRIMRSPRSLGLSPSTASLVNTLLITSAREAVAVFSSSSATRGCSRGPRVCQAPQAGVRTLLAGTLGQPHSTRRSASGSTEKADRMSPTALRASGRSSLLCQHSLWKSRGIMRC